MVTLWARVGGLVQREHGKALVVGVGAPEEAQIVKLPGGLLCLVRLHRQGRDSQGKAQGQRQDQGKYLFHGVLLSVQNTAPL